MIYADMFWMMIPSHVPKILIYSQQSKVMVFCVPESDFPMVSDHDLSLRTTSHNLFFRVLDHELSSLVPINAWPILWCHRSCTVLMSTRSCYVLWFQLTIYDYVFPGLTMFSRTPGSDLCWRVQHHHLFYNVKDDDLFSKVTYDNLSPSYPRFWSVSPTSRSWFILTCPMSGSIPDSLISPIMICSLSSGIAHRSVFSSTMICLNCRTKTILSSHFVRWYLHYL